MKFVLTVMNFPIPLAIVSFAGLSVSTQLGAYVSRRRPPQPHKEQHNDLDVVLTATLTLLGLIIGFCFSMALGRYDQRKQYESEEANKIGSEYSRLGLLPRDAAAELRGFLRAYLGQRILFYEISDTAQLDEIRKETACLQHELWSGTEEAARAQPTVTAGLATSGMNEVLDSEGYTQAAWWNRIPIPAWSLMAIVAIFGNALLGFNASSPRAANPSFLILPLILGVAFLLIADLDSPRGGIIRIHPINLESLSLALGGPRVPAPISPAERGQQTPDPEKKCSCCRSSR